APGGLCEPRLQCRWQLQLVETEHRQPKSHKKRGKQEQHPRLLQRSGETFAGETGCDAKRGVDNRDAKRVSEREREAAHLARLVSIAVASSRALSNDDRRQDR